MTTTASTTTNKIRLGDAGLGVSELVADGCGPETDYRRQSAARMRQ